MSRSKPDEGSPSTPKNQQGRSPDPPADEEKKGIDWSNPSTYIAIVVVLGGIIGAGAGLISIGEWKGKREAFEVEVSKFMSEIRDELKEISQKLPKSSVYSGSPLRLTELGETISDDLKIRAWAEKTALKVVSQTEGKDLYQIQNFCIDFVEKRKYNPPKGFLKALRNSAYHKGVPIKTIEKVLAIELRDELLRIREKTPPPPSQED